MRIIRKFIKHIKIENEPNTKICVSKFQYDLRFERKFHIVKLQNVLQIDNRRHNKMIGVKNMKRKMIIYIL